MQGDITKIKDHLAELKGEFVASKNSLTHKVNTLIEELASANECVDGHGDCIAQLRERFVTMNRLGLLLEIR